MDELEKFVNFDEGFENIKAAEFVYLHERGNSYGTFDHRLAQPLNSVKKLNILAILVILG